MATTPTWIQETVPVEGWEGAGHEVGGAWIEVAGRIGAWALLAVLLALVVRAFLRRHRYRATDVLDAEDLEALHAELVETERHTVGEVVPVVLERSDAHPAASWLSGVFVTLVGCAVLAPVLPWDHPGLLLACQAVLLALGYGLAELLPDYKRVFVRESRATEMAQEQALQEFYRHGLHETEGATGVLLFVSLFEHRVVVLGDRGIDAKVEPELWVRADRAILEGIRKGSLRDGLMRGLRAVGAVLTDQFPPDGERNEVPDRIVVRRQ